MRLFQYITFFIFSFCSAIVAVANDGSYFASGNQLIPIFETDISVQKEILTIKKVNNKYIEVIVYYEFFNPKEAKEIFVGFEANSPSGDVDGQPVGGRHPYMHDFTVQMNGAILNYDIALVNDNLYAKDGKVHNLKYESISGNTSGNSVDFFYVYHFKAHFKKGLNIVKHTYKYNVSSSVAYYYDFEYILTAANRWANKQIDDFTLIIDMGDFESFFINKTFFDKSEDWLVNGIGKVVDAKKTPIGFYEYDALRFHIQTGYLIFQKKNFKIKGELFLGSERSWVIGRKDQLQFNYHYQEYYDESNSELERKIYRNLPFARRGYVFKTKDLQDFFQTQDWYIPNPNYFPNVELLHPIEKESLECRK